MPKRTSTYRGATAAKRKAEATAPTGRFAGLRRAAARVRRAITSRLPASRRRRELVIVGSLALAVIVGVGAIGAGVYIYKVDRDWATVATVNGHSISREELRARVPVVEFLAAQRLDYIRVASTAGHLTDDEAASLSDLVEGEISDPIEAARDQLIDEELLRQQATKEGVAAPTNVDEWQEAASYVSSDVAVILELVRFGLPDASSGPTNSGSTDSGAGTAANGWPTASASNVQVATDRVRQELTNGTSSETVVAGLHDAGWTVFGRNLPLSADGAPDDPTLEVDPVVAAGALKLADTSNGPGTILGPSTDLYHRVTLARVLPTTAAAYLRDRLPGLADPKMDLSSLQSWADSQALGRALETKLRTGWASAPQNLAHFRELVIGTAPASGTAGPWVELSDLPTDLLARFGPAVIASAPPGLDSLAPDALAATLRGLDVPAREALFRNLVAAANSTAPTNDAGVTTTTPAGEMGYLGQGDLTTDLGKAAFDSSVKTGDILGPIPSSAGPQLYLVEARYAGPLDDRALTALQQVRADNAPDLSTYRSRFSPADAPLATDAGWRADIEFATAEPARSALFDTPIGLLSDPFVLDGNLGLAVVTERKTGTPDAATAARIYLDGYSAWFASARAAATITRSDNPLPELLPSASPTPSNDLTLPSAPLPLATPVLPSI